MAKAKPSEQQTQEPEQTQEQPTPKEPTAEELAQAEAEAEAAFESGYTGAQGEKPSTKGKPDQSQSQDEQEQQSQETNAEQQGDGEQPQASEKDDGTPSGKDDGAKVLANLTEPEIKALLAQAAQVNELKAGFEKRFEQVFGKFGEIQRQISGAQQAKPAEQQMSQRQINAESFKRLKTEYPDFAPLLAEDLSEILQTPVASPANGITQEQVNQYVNGIVEQRVSEAVDSINEQLLSTLHADWEDIAKSDDLQLWLGTKAPEYREKFLSSRNAAYVASALTEFKGWRENGKAQRQRNESRLERNINPKGGSSGGPTGLTDEDAFLVGAGERPG